MLIHKTFTTQKERKEIIANMKLRGYFQIPITGYFIGEEHLLFSNGIEPPPLTPDEARAQELLGTSPPVITMPAIWELLRIIGRRLGYRFD